MVSGHTDLTIEEFNQHYREHILSAIDLKDSIIGASGADKLTQELCHSMLYYNVTVIDKGRQDNRVTNLFTHVNGFESYIVRDEYMTANSNVDIAYVRSNPIALGSGTQCNIHRRLYGKEVANRLLYDLRMRYSVDKEKPEYNESDTYLQMLNLCKL
jgi:hypothetical protein